MEIIVIIVVFVLVLGGYKIGWDKREADFQSNSVQWVVGGLPVLNVSRDGGRIRVDTQEKKFVEIRELEKKS